MRWTKRDPGARTERSLITGMIISDQVLREIRSVYREGLLTSPFADVVARWCSEYWDRYQRAPGREIEQIFSAEKRDLQEDLVPLVEEFLESLSSEHERGPDSFNSRHCLDRGLQYMRIRRLEVLQEEMKESVDQGDPERAETLMADYTRIDRVPEGKNPFTDEELIRSAFRDQDQPLFRMPGALGDLLRGQLVRENFLAFQAPEKRGKTWWLMELSHQALKQRNNVVFVACGDMTSRQMAKRWGVRLLGRSFDPHYCKSTLIPVLDCASNQDDSCDFEIRTSPCGLLIPGEEEGEMILPRPGDEDRKYRPCVACKKAHPKYFKGAYWYRKRGEVDPISWREVVDAGERFSRHWRGNDIRIIEYPSDSFSIPDLEGVLVRWEELEGFVPDVVVVDYIDIMAPGPGAPSEFRHQENNKWKQFRALTQKWRCLGITATQADAKAMERKSQNTGSFSEDKRKYGHATGVLALNQTPEEKKRGIMRIGWLVLREGYFDIRQEVKILMHLPSGKPHVSSYW